MNKYNKKIYIFYGAGSYAIQNIDKLLVEWDGVCFADANKNKWGSNIGGLVVYSIDDALSKFPSAEIVITVNSNFKATYDYLINKGIDAKKISFVVPREKRKGCTLLGKCIQLDGGKIMKTCCYEKAYKQIMHSTLKKEFDIFSHEVTEINNGLKNNYPTSCDGCSMLYEDWWEINPKIETISLASGFRDDICNCECVYCDAQQFLESSKDNKNISVLEACEFFSNEEIFDNASFILNNGEFVLNKYRREILEMCKKKRRSISLYTNGTYLSQDLIEYMKTIDTTLICSLDAGTADTFKKIKKVDLFKRTIENLKEYAKYASIELKYILLKDYNDSIEDIEGFVEIAGCIAKKVILSRDLFLRHIPLSEREKEIYRYFIEEICNKKSIPIQFYEDCIPESDINWIRELMVN